LGAKFHPNQTHKRRFRKSNIQPARNPVFGEVSSDLALPSFSETWPSLIILVIGLPLIYILSKAFKLRPKPIAIEKPKKEVILAVVVAVILLIVVFSWRTLIHLFGLFDERSPFIIGPMDVLWVAFLDGVCFAVVIIAMRSTRQTLGSIGLSKDGIGRMFALGLALSAIYLTLWGLVAPLLGLGFPGFSLQLAYGFVLLAMVGFSEEAFWRGYIQTRIIASVGRVKGLLVTSLLFAVLWHFPVEFYLQSGDVLVTLVNALMRFVPGLLFGYLMLRSQNVLPSSILHLFWNWNLLLWELTL